MKAVSPCLGKLTQFKNRSNYSLSPKILSSNVVVFFSTNVMIQFIASIISFFFCQHCQYNFRFTFLYMAVQLEVCCQMRLMIYQIAKMILEMI